MESNTTELAAHLARLAPSRPAHLIAEDSDTFRRLAMRAKRHAESLCNGFFSQEDYDERMESVRRAAAKVAAEYPELSAAIGGDPRGCCFYLKHPKMPGNTWGGAESGFGVW
jgi:hypothetical protein